MRDEKITIPTLAASYLPMLDQVLPIVANLPPSWHFRPLYRLLFLVPEPAFCNWGKPYGRAKMLDVAFLCLVPLMEPRKRPYLHLLIGEQRPKWVQPKHPPALCVVDKRKTYHLECVSTLMSIITPSSKFFIFRPPTIGG